MVGAACIPPRLRTRPRHGPRADHARARVVALLYVMLLAGMMVSAIVIGRMLDDFTPTKLVQLIQGAAVLTMVLNLVALWKQEARSRQPVAARLVQTSFRDAWALFIARPQTMRLLVAVGLGAAAFGMQDVLLEPYGGQILGVGRRYTLLTHCGHSDA